MKTNKKKILIWIAFFLIFFTAAQFFSQKNGKNNGDTNAGTGSATEALTITPGKIEYASGTEVIMDVKNNTGSIITLPSGCPRNPFRVLAWNGNMYKERSSKSALNCDQVGGDLIIAPDKSIKVSYNFWNYSLFGEPNRYRVEIDLPTATKTATTDGGIETISSPEFTVVEAGFWRMFFRNFLFKPLYNVLVFLISVAPAHDLGFAIILLTIIIRLILLVPSQRAIVSQRRMQELQPKLEQIKKKYAGNQERIAQETMNLWKEHKVNPFGSCLPMLIQFPILIALFYVIRNGLNPDNVHLIYGPLAHVDLVNVHTNFLGILELTTVNAFALPLIVGALQFFQLKLAMAKKKDGDAGGKGAEMAMANKTMTYIMPVMIAVFTASVPAGVGLYWGVSTLFALVQQTVANRNVKI